jgi:hypothetical protein
MNDDIIFPSSDFKISIKRETAQVDGENELQITFSFICDELKLNHENTPFEAVPSILVEESDPYYKTLNEEFPKSIVEALSSEELTFIEEMLEHASFLKDKMSSEDFSCFVSSFIFPMLFYQIEPVVDFLNAPEVTEFEPVEEDLLATSKIKPFSLGSITFSHPGKEDFSTTLPLFVFGIEDDEIHGLLLEDLINPIDNELEISKFEYVIVSKEYIHLKR